MGSGRYSGPRTPPQSRPARPEPLRIRLVHIRAPSADVGGARHTPQWQPPWAGCVLFSNLSLHVIGGVFFFKWMAHQVLPSTLPGSPRAPALSLVGAYVYSAPAVPCRGELLAPFHPVWHRGGPITLCPLRSRPRAISRCAVACL